jgi:hypothetical protein
MLRCYEPFRNSPLLLRRTPANFRALPRRYPPLPPLHLLRVPQEWLNTALYRRQTRACQRTNGHTRPLTAATYPTFAAATALVCSGSARRIRPTRDREIHRLHCRYLSRRPTCSVGHSGGAADPAREPESHECRYRRFAIKRLDLEPGLFNRYPRVCQSDDTS